jgi:hypothetical protein
MASAKVGQPPQNRKGELPPTLAFYQNQVTRLLESSIVL